VNGVGLVFLNLATFAYNQTGSSLFNAIGNAVSLLLISYSIYQVVLAKEDSSLYKSVLMLAVVFVGASFLVNYGSFEIPDALKFLSIYTFYIAGRSASGRLRQAEKWCVYALAALPLLFLLAGQSRIYMGAEYPDAFSYFPNTNTAALYFSALFFSLSPWLGNGTLALQFINVVLMNRVGAALATILSIGVWSVYPLRKEVVVAFSVLSAASLVAYAIGAMDRLLTGLEAITVIWNLNPSTVARMTYKQLVEITGTSDVSAFFRIIHWTNIWDYYSSQGIVGILFGYGAGQTGVVAYMPMPPHNDYLRVLAEYGLLSFFVFVFFLANIVLSIKLKPAKILFTVLLIYFFSENLIDNFTSMALFFSYAGRITSERSFSGAT